MRNETNSRMRADRVKNSRWTMVIFLSFVIFHLSLSPVAAQEDGHRLWLRMQPTESTVSVKCSVETPTTAIAVDELRRYWRGTPTISLSVNDKMPADDGFAIRRIPGGGLAIEAANDRGLLYAVYHLLRLQATHQPINPCEQHPTFALRLLNHWDNLDGTIERGYAGRSIFWSRSGASLFTLHSSLNAEANSSLFTLHSSLLKDYARANASIGINGTVLNNVNASPRMLATEYLDSVRAIADVLRPYGIRVFLSVNFASPMKVAVESVNGGRVLSTADPLDPQVAQWWKAKVDEIYRLIPDFGGFLVKANSEGQPGPGDYKRSHAEGANMMADALAPHKGIVMWRAFVYGYHEGATDRVMKAVNEFKPLDGKFRNNVIIQIKNGPLDFQPREPYSPLFDQLHQTPMMPELQITQEYLGQSRHLVYLGTMWQEFFQQLGVRSEELGVRSEGQKSLNSQLSTLNFPAIAGVANIGLDANWCGHHFSQANWYVFGRMAWDPTLSSRTIAREWLQQTFTDDERFLVPMTDVMETSREACVDYMMPLGLHHIFKGDHHYGPEPEGNQPNFPDEWKPVWYHKADKGGIGFNRSTHGGTGASQQYREPYASLFDDPATCPEELLLWFHHLPWDFPMADGSTLWQSLQRHYRQGVEKVDAYVATWQQMRPYVDPQRHREVSDRLDHQQQNARQWRDHCINYFRQFAEADL